MIVFPDVEIETRTYLLGHLETEWPDIEVRFGIPEKTDWQTDKPYLVLITATGTGARASTVYERVLLGFECFAPTQAEASRLVSDVRAAMTEWPFVSGMVAAQSDNARPARSDQPDVAYPSYWYSTNLNFKASER